MNLEPQQEEYVTGLEAFLDSSEEDRLIEEAIVKQLPSFAPELCNYMQNGEGIRILDVGSGNGQKAIFLAKVITTKKQNINIVIDSLEPKEEQRKHLYERYANTHFMGRVFNDTLAKANFGWLYDLVIILHSLYEFYRDSQGKILSLDRLGKIMFPHGCAVIAIEHPDGDFQRMKKALYPQFGKMPAVSLSIICETLAAANIPYQVGEIIDYNFPINDILALPEEEIGKHLAFLFATSLSEPNLTEEQYQIIGEWVKSNKRIDGESFYLHTPDILIWIYPN